MDTADTLKSKLTQDEKHREAFFQVLEMIRRERITGTVLIMVSANQGGVRGIETGKVSWLK